MCRSLSDEAFIDWILLTWAKNPERATGQCSIANVPHSAAASNLAASTRLSGGPHKSHEGALRRNHAERQSLV